MPPPDNIFTSCKKGDLARIKYLVETKEVDLNVRDCWDSTPLYYACHCGHESVVSYLLENGARCEASTFDGERCLYGALTNEIKHLLLDSKLINNIDKKRDDFDDFCEKMLNDDQFSDIVLRLGQHEFKLHRVVLAARSEYFKSTLQTKWKEREIRTNAINPIVFAEFVRYMYTGRIHVDREHFEEMVRLAEQCKIENLKDFLRNAQAEAEYFELSKNRVKISTLIIHSPETRRDLTADFESVISSGIPEGFGNPFFELRSTAGVVEGTRSELMDPVYDICLKVDGHLFYCNKVFLCYRSEYFNTLIIKDHFSEIDSQHQRIPTLALKNVKPSIFACILYYIYTNDPSFSNSDEILEVLETAELYLLPGLKKLCGNSLCDFISHDTVVELLKISRMHDLVKLEDSCSEFLGENITSFIDDEEFKQIVLSDAQDVSDRHETDTISIIDDIRYHITNGLGSFSELQEAQSKLKIIDDLLEELGLEA